MDGDDMNLAVFNGNGLEYPKKHCFFCESIWTVRQVQDDMVKRVYMTMNFRHHALNWYMKLYVVLT